MKITVDRFLEWKPRSDYPSERVIELWDGRDGLTMLEFLDLNISATDRVWVACKRGVLPPGIRVRWIEGIVTRAVTKYALTCGIPKVESWARSWIDGTDRTAGAAGAALARAKAEAAKSTWAAAWDADARAASAAAKAAKAAGRAAVAAASAADARAARAAAYAAWATAWDAAWSADTERQQQIEDLKVLLSEDYV